jgi:hypothetical protein
MLWEYIAKNGRQWYSFREIFTEMHIVPLRYAFAELKFRNKNLKEKSMSNGTGNTNETSSKLERIRAVIWRAFLVLAIVNHSVLTILCLGYNGKYFLVNPLPWAAIVIGICSALTVISCFIIWFWKKWAVYVAVIVNVTAGIVGFVSGQTKAGVLLIVGILILISLLRHHWHKFK